MVFQPQAVPACGTGTALLRLMKSPTLGTLASHRSPFAVVARPT